MKVQPEWETGRHPECCRKHSEKALDFSPDMRYYFQDKFQADHLTGKRNRIPRRMAFDTKRG